MTLLTTPSTAAKAMVLPMANDNVVHTEIPHAAVDRSSRILENISNSADRVNEWAPAIRIHLAAQTVNVHVYYVRCSIDTHAPDVIEDHGSRHYASSIAAEIFKQRKLLRSKLQQLCSATGFSPNEV